MAHISVLGPNFANLWFWVKVINFNCYINIRLVLSAKFHNNWAHCNFETESVQNQVANFGSRSAISNMIFMINERDLLWLPNVITLGINFVFGTKFSWNEGIDTCFNTQYVLLGRKFDFLGGYLVVFAHYLVVTAS